MNNGGDVLARGGASAQFSAGGTNYTDFEADFIFKDVAEVCKKYALSEAEYDTYSAMRANGERLPDLKSIDESGKIAVDFSVTDHRKNYLNIEEAVKAVEPEALKYPAPSFEAFHPILDRILVMRISDNPEEEMLEDGSTRNRRTGLITAAKYRQHSNVGIVLSVGKYVVLGGVKFNLTEFVQAGDKITYGEYNAEAFPMDEAKVQAICDTLQVNYVKDPKGLFVVRIQDVRGVEPKVKEVQYV